MVIGDLLNEARATARRRHLSLRTEAAYLSTIRRFIYFHGRKHPRQLGAAHIRDYLSHLAVEGEVAASTQNVAFNAILFLYRDVLQMNLPNGASGALGCANHYDLYARFAARRQAVRSPLDT